MNMIRKVALFSAVTVAATGLPLLAASTATAAGGANAIQTVGSCGGFLREKEVSAGQLILNIVVPDGNANSQWTFAAQQQDYGATTGGREGNPVDLVANHTLPQPQFNAVEGGFATMGQVVDTSGLTHGFSFTATRAADGLVCTGQAFWTTPANAQGPVAPPNPDGKPDTPPALTGATEADSGTNDVLLQFDQEMLDTAQGIPATSRFSITVDGVARNATVVQVINDSPPADAVVDLTFDGAPLTSGQTVSVTYHKPLGASAAQLQDLDGLDTAGFGPTSVPVF